MAELSSDEVRGRLHRRIDELPVLPSVIGQLMTLDREDENYFDRVLALIEADPTFSARVVSAANSAESAPRSPISSVRMALARLGSAGAANLILAMAVSRVFVPRDDWERSLWRHALQVAVAMRMLAPHSTDPVAFDADEGFAAGLLHDVGRFVLLGEAPDTLRRIDEGDWDDPEALVALERSICGLSHGEIGEMACTRWGLPETISEVVRRHHEPNWAPVGGGVSAMIAMVHFADLAMFPSAMPGTPGYDSAEIETIENDLMPKVPKGLVLTAEQLHGLIVTVTEEVDVTCRSLGIA